MPERRHHVVDARRQHAQVQTNVNLLLNKDPRKSKVKRAHGSQRVIRSVVARLSGKGGRMRRTIMGKRVNNCSRAVIGADP